MTSLRSRFLFFSSLIFFISLIFFGLWRGIFLFRYLNLTQGIPYREILRSFWIGLRFDMVITSYALILFFIIGSFLPLAQKNSLRFFFLTALSFMFGFCFFLCLIDLEFFGVYNSRLNILAIQYLDTPGPVMQTIWKEYPVITYLLLWLILSSLFGWLIFRLGRAFLVESGGYTSPLSKVIILLSGLSLLVLGARGTLDFSPINWGYAYFSEYNFLNQMALNSIFTIGRSLYQEFSEKNNVLEKNLHVTSDQEAISLVQNLVAGPDETYLSPEDYPMVRSRRFSSPATFKPNVVILIMESFTASFVGALGGPYRVTPEFDRLCQEGILFENFYANGSRTNRGLTSILCSYPCLVGLAMMKKIESQQPMLTIADILKPSGYQNCFIYGGDLYFDNMEGFFRHHGFDEFIGRQNFPEDAFQNEWGISDEMVFECANQKFKTMKEPFLGAVLTVTNHEPYNIPKPYAYYPPDHYNSKFLNSFKYSDHALGEFFRQARKETYFNNTIFVIVADHGRILNYQTDLNLHQFHIPCLFYAPKLLGAHTRREQVIGSQLDIIPTLLGILRLPVVHHCWGRDFFLIKPNNGYAMLTGDDEKLGLVQNPYYLIVRFDAPSSLYLIDHPTEDRSMDFPEILTSMERQVKTIAQASHYIFAHKQCWDPKLRSIQSVQLD